MMSICFETYITDYRKYVSKFINCVSAEDCRPFFSCFLTTVKIYPDLNFFLHDLIQFWSQVVALSLHMAAVAPVVEQSL